MQAVGVRLLQNLDDQILIEITLARRRRPYCIGFTCQRQIRRSGIGLGIERDGLDAHFVQRAQHTGSDGTAVCYDNFVKHFKTF